jgi:hypothetical protein
VTPQPGPSQVWIDAPLPYSTIPLLPYKLVFHGASFVGLTEFEIKIDGTVITTTPPVSSGSGGPNYGTMFLGEYTWHPPGPGTYLISIRALGNGEYSPPALVEVTVSGGKEIDLPAAKPTDTPPVEIQQCIYTALINQFCRRSSGSGYEAIDNFVIGQSALVVGISVDGYFWYVVGPNYGEVCTVPTAPRFGETTGPCEEKPRYTPIPSPTPTLIPTPCPAARPCD